jgi:hypothetical protein
MHDTVNHAAEEWRRDDVRTNTVEGYFSILPQWGQTGPSGQRIASRRAMAACSSH